MQMLKSVDHLLEQHMYIYIYFIKIERITNIKTLHYFRPSLILHFVPRRRGAPASIRIAAPALFFPLCRVQSLISLSPLFSSFAEFAFDLMIITTQNERGNLHFYASIGALVSFASKTLWFMYVWAESNVNGRGGERLGPDQNLWSKKLPLFLFASIPS